MNALALSGGTVHQYKVIPIGHILQHRVDGRGDDGLPGIHRRCRDEVQILPDRKDHVGGKAPPLREIQDVIEAIILQPQSEIHISHAHISIDEKYFLPLPGQVDAQGRGEESLPYAALSGSKG